MAFCFNHSIRAHHGDLADNRSTFTHVLLLTIILVHVWLFAVYRLVPSVSGRMSAASNADNAQIRALNRHGGE